MNDPYRTRQRQYRETPAVEWEDADENSGEWPYPTRYERRTMTGDLADAVRRRVAAPAGAEVTITETAISGGWSEFTQETDYGMTVTCNGVDHDFYSLSDENNLVRLLAWLDEEPATAASPTPEGTEK